MSPRYAWLAIFSMIEKWPADLIQSIDATERLHKAEELADMLCVTPQTVRNYGKAGKFHVIRITPRTIRYSPHFCEDRSEAKAA
jgi:hypothetical protein